MSLLDGKENIFLSGPPGTGKSFTVKEYIKDREGVLVTASTGIAANELGGITLHRALGLQLCQGSIDKLVALLMKRKKIYNMWRNEIQELVIDELSMLDIGFFLRASAIVSEIRQDPRPWGGIRLILVADYCQLPPIRYYQEGEEENAKTYKFLFQHPIWQQLNLKTIYLTIPRRTIDPGYLAVLADIRYGILSDRVKDFMKGRSKKPTIKNGVKPSMLIGTNNEVDLYNKQELDKLQGDLHTFVYSFDTSVPENLMTREQLEGDFRKGSTAPDVLELKMGAQVMHLVNDADRGLYNGSRGVVIDISDSGYPIVKFKNGKVFTIEPYTWTSHIRIEGEKYKMARTQIPLKLCWACSIHKSQGCTLDSAVIMVNTCFEGGMLYVGLSRCRSPDDLFVIGWDEKTMHHIWKKCKPDQAVIKFYGDLEQS